MGVPPVRWRQEISFNKFECMHQTTRFHITEDGDQGLVNYVIMIQKNYA
jgi:hypothetical protein